MNDLSALLAEWHRYRAAYRAERGFAPLAAWRSSATLDEIDEACERCRIVEREADELPPIFRLALEELARAQDLGVAVIRNPRLPAEPQARERLFEAALRAISKRLIAAGLLMPQNPTP